MKKEYVKPEIENVNFNTEAIADIGVPGVGSLPPEWDE